MTLDEAHGNYYEIRNILARVFVRANGDDDGKTIRILDAAVRDCMLAAVAAVTLYNPRPGGIATTASQVEAKIVRQFGLPKGAKA